MGLGTPIAIVNFKTYESSTGQNAVKLAEAIAKIGGENVAVAVTACDIFPVSSSTKMPVLAQHCDPVDFGAHTGSILLENAEAAGATGTLINHAEKKVPHEFIAAVVKKAKLLGMTVVACAADLEEAKTLARMEPDFVAVEPPELIGAGISVSSAKPEIVSGSVNAVKAISPRVNVLCGAGISSREDVRRAIELGADGVLLASFITKAKDPEKATREIVEGLG